jgi:hypothetical protein
MRVPTVLLTGAARDSRNAERIRVPSCVQRDAGGPGIDLVERSYLWQAVGVALFCVVGIVWAIRMSVDNEIERRGKAAEVSGTTTAAPSESVTAAGSLTREGWIVVLGLLAGLVFVVVSYHTTRITIDKNTLTLTESSDYAPCAKLSECRTVSLSPSAIATLEVCVKRATRLRWFIRIYINPPFESSEALSGRGILLEEVSTSGCSEHGGPRDEADALKRQWAEYLGGLCATGAWNAHRRDDESTDEADAELAVV